MMNDVMTIIGKELTRVFTDRKLVFTTFLLPAISLVLIYSVMGIMVKNMVADREEHMGQVVVVNPPASFEAFLKDQKDLKLQFETRSDAEVAGLKQQIYNGKLESMVVFTKDFDAAVGAYKTEGSRPNVLTYFNPAEDYSQAAHDKLVGQVLDNYEKRLLVSRFGSEDYLKAFTLDKDNKEQQQAPPERVSGDFLGGLVPMLLSIFLFSGGMGIGIDLITGEKERGTMATMLVTPIRREAIAFGKMLSLGIISLVSTASSLAGMAIAFPFLIMAFNGGEPSGGGGNGFGLMSISPIGVLQFVILAILLTLIYVGLICIVSVYANTMKEAGTLITPAYMVIMLLGVATLFGNGIPKLWVFATPVYGTLMGMKHALSAELSWTMFGVNVATSLVFIVVIIWGIKQMFNSEKVMFGA